MPCECLACQNKYLIFAVFVAILSSTVFAFEQKGASLVGQSVCDNITEFQVLNASSDMPAIIGSIEVKVPLNVLWNFISQLRYYPYWNPLFTFVNTTEFKLCSPLVAGFAYPPQVTGINSTLLAGPHTIVEFNCTGTYATVAWAYYGVDKEILTGRHQYSLFSLSDSTTLFINFEKAMGMGVRGQNSIPWTACLQAAMQDGFIGIHCLDQVYMNKGKLDPIEVVEACSAPNFSPLNLNVNFKSN